MVLYEVSLEQKVNSGMDRFGTQLETITEEERSILAQFEIVNVTGSDEEEPNPESTVKSTTSLENSINDAEKAS